MSSGTGLSPYKHAAFAVTSRLISCLVTEQLLKAFYIPTPQWKMTSGIMVMLRTPASMESRLPSPIPASEVFAIVPLLRTPVLTKGGPTIGLLDPLDVMPHFYELRFVDITLSRRTQPDPFSQEIFSLVQTSGWQLSNHSNHIIHEVFDPLFLWNKFSDCIGLPTSTRETISKELSSSHYHQYLAYSKPPSCPTLNSPPIEWEQSLVAGHPTHPMHRARLLDFVDADYNWYRPAIRFVQISKSNLSLRGSFGSVSRSLVSKALKGSSMHLDHERFVFMPVLELQIPNIVKLFPGVVVLPPEVHLDAQAQTSIRTVIVPELPGHALKLSIGVKISSSLRTISHFTADFGPRFSSHIVPKLSIDKSIFVVETEPSSAIYLCDDPEIQKHFTVVVRKEYEPAGDENVLIVAALLETDHVDTPPGLSVVEHIFGLDTEKKRTEFLDRYLHLSCQAFLPALIHNGVAFEAHAQNTLLRVDKNTRKLTGFVLRDLGGMRVHPPTLRKSTGANFEFLPQHCIVTETIQEIYPKFYHTYVHSHVQRLIRLLDLHHNGIGWQLLRRHMNGVIPNDHELRALWLSPTSLTVESKCLMRMRLQDSYRENVYRSIPNMIQFRPDKVDRRRESML